MPNIIRITESFTEVATKSIDDRNRLSIAEVANSVYKGITRFKIFQSANGDVLLRPVIEIPAQELWLHKNKEAREMVAQGIKESGQGKGKKLDESLLAPEE
ncbi:MAG: hypothetical protein WCT14_01145 [Treponemataceae bacterium]